MPKLAFTVLVKEEEDGTFSAVCLELEGCMTQADTDHELMENIVDAIQLNVDWLRSEGKPIPSAAIDYLSGGNFAIPDKIPDELRKKFSALDAKMFHSENQRRIILA